MIETLQIFWQSPIELRVIILAVPICFLILHKESEKNKEYE
tara:strand:+ start:632 stop:754 length:123 start_codon:yes stop_codon:yes gene_type:complete